MRCHKSTAGGLGEERGADRCRAVRTHVILAGLAAVLQPLSPLRSGEESGLRTVLAGASFAV